MLNRSAPRVRRPGFGWCSEPVTQLGPGVPRHHRLLPVSTQSRRSTGWTPHSVVSNNPWEGKPMDVRYERCCGLDIHKKVVTACLITPGPDGRPHKEIRSFGTMTDGLLTMKRCRWARAESCRHATIRRLRKE